MHEPKGRYLPLDRPARVHRRSGAFRAQDPVGPGQPDVRRLGAGAIRGSGILSRPSWSCLFMKAYALVGAEHAPLRRSYLEFPWPRLYEHPWMNCAWRSSGTYQGEEGRLRGPVPGARAAVAHAASDGPRVVQERAPGEGRFYRQALRFSKVPRPVRRFIWWSTLNVSGFKRCKRFGTFGLSSATAPRRRADPPDLAADDHADVTGRSTRGRPRDGQADLRPSSSGRRVRRPTTRRDRRGPQRIDPRRTSSGPRTGVRARTPRNVEPLLKPHLPGVARLRALPPPSRPPPTRSSRKPKTTNSDFSPYSLEDGSRGRWGGSIFDDPPIAGGRSPRNAVCSRSRARRGRCDFVLGGRRPGAVRTLSSGPAAAWRFRGIDWWTQLQFSSVTPRDAPATGSHARVGTPRRTGSRSTSSPTPCAP